jgi:hypothetical protein
MEQFHTAHVCCRQRVGISQLNVFRVLKLAIQLLHHSAQCLFSIEAQRAAPATTSCFVISHFDTTSNLGEIAMRDRRFAAKNLS